MDSLNFIEKQQKENDPKIIIIRINCCECPSLNWLLSYILEIFISKIKNYILENQENPNFKENESVLQICKKIPKPLTIYQFINVFKKMNHFRVALVNEKNFFFFSNFRIDFR